MQDNNYIGGIAMSKRNYTQVKELLPTILNMVV